MGTLSIRDLDDRVIEYFKIQAKVNRRSLEVELRHVLTEAADRRRHVREFGDRTRALGSMKAGTTMTDGVTLLRGDRPPERPEGWLGAMSDRVRILGDITTPTSELVPWGAEQD